MPQLFVLLLHCLNMSSKQVVYGSLDSAMTLHLTVTECHDPSSELPLQSAVNPVSVL